MTENTHTVITGPAHRLVLTVADPIGPARPEHVTGRWSVDTCATHHDTFGGWHMKFAHALAFPAEATIAEVAEAIGHRVRPTMLTTDERVVIALSFVDPDGIVGAATITLTR